MLLTACMGKVVHRTPSGDGNRSFNTVGGLSTLPSGGRRDALL